MRTGYLVVGLMVAMGLLVRATPVNAACIGEEYCAGECNQLSTQCTCTSQACSVGKGTPADNCYYSWMGQSCKGEIIYDAYGNATGCTSCPVCLTSQDTHDCPAAYNPCINVCPVTGSPQPSSSSPPTASRWCKVSVIRNGLDISGPISPNTPVNVLVQGVTGSTSNRLQLWVRRQQGPIVPTPPTTQQTSTNNAYRIATCRPSSNAAACNATVSDLALTPEGDYYFFCQIRNSSGDVLCNGSPYCNDVPIPAEIPSPSPRISCAQKYCGSNPADGWKYLRVTGGSYSSSVQGAVRVTDNKDVCNDTLRTLSPSLDPDFPNGRVLLHDEDGGSIPNAISQIDNTHSAYLFQNVIGSAAGHNYSLNFSLNASSDYEMTNCSSIHTISVTNSVTQTSTNTTYPDFYVYHKALLPANVTVNISNDDLGCTGTSLPSGAGNVPVQLTNTTTGTVLAQPAAGPGFSTLFTSVPGGAWNVSITSAPAGWSISSLCNPGGVIPIAVNGVDQEVTFYIHNGTPPPVTTESAPWWQIMDGDGYAAGTANAYAPDTAADGILAQTAPNRSGALIAGGTVDVNGTLGPDRTRDWSASQSPYDTASTENFDWFLRLVEMLDAPSLSTDDLSLFGNDYNSLSLPATPPSGDRAAYYLKPPDGTAVIQTGWDITDNPDARGRVIFVDGNLEINSNITVETGTFLAFIVRGSITFDPAVTQVQGMYIADEMIRVPGIGGSDDNQFVGEGTFVGWQGWVLSRDLGGTANATLPAEQFVYRPDFITNLPEAFHYAGVQWQEVAPNSTSANFFAAETACTPDEYRCIGTYTPQHCNSAGTTWETLTSCVAPTECQSDGSSYQCVVPLPEPEATPSTECTAGEKGCLDENTPRLCVDGTWETQTKCITGTVCVSGNCELQTIPEEPSIPSSCSTKTKPLCEAEEAYCVGTIWHCP